jgi:hypothetical protein
MTETRPSLRFVVFGRPQQKGSKRALPIRSVKGRGIVLVDANRNAAPWAHKVTTEAIRAMDRDGHRHLLGPEGVWVELRFYFDRPKSHHGTGRNAQILKPTAPARMTAMPDLDKLARCALDALTGCVIHDDAQVCELVAAKRYGSPERVEVTVVAL